MEKMINKFEAREKAFSLADSELDTTPVFTQYSPIYIASTSNVCETLNLYQDYQRVLSVCGSGAHGYEALLHGAKSVDLFDINALQILYFEYMKTGIKCLKYEDFIKYFTIKNDTHEIKIWELSELLSNSLFEQLEKELRDDVRFVFGSLYEYYDSLRLIRSGLFRLNHSISREHLKKFVSFYREEEYYRLQKILRQDYNVIRSHLLSLTEVPKQFQGSYDLILLDNILQYFRNIPSISTPSLVHDFIHNQLGNLLSENGKIQTNYAFEVQTAFFEESLNPNFKDLSETFFLGELLKEGIRQVDVNFPLVQNYKNYSYDYVLGVTSTKERKVNNLVLTYQKD